MQVGDKAPEVLGINEKGEEIRLSDYKGKKTVLYFYPKDMTSGCTAQACNLRDNYSELRKAGYEVIGVSVDNEKSHQKFIEKNMYDETSNSYLRNTEDKKMDISMLGMVVPFNMFSAKDKKVKNTIEKINLSLRTYTGGYQRFENDNYMNGNPWPIANLWMTLYYLEIGEKEKAKETFDFVIKTSGRHEFLGEQVDNNTLRPNWVIGLGWSHAMFVIALEALTNNKVI